MSIRENCPRHAGNPPVAGFSAVTRIFSSADYLTPRKMRFCITQVYKKHHHCTVLFAKVIKNNLLKNVRIVPFWGIQGML